MAGEDEVKGMAPRQIMVSVRARGLVWSYKFVLKQINKGFLPARRPSRNMIMVKRSDFEEFYSSLHDGNNGGGENNGINSGTASAAGA